MYMKKFCQPRPLEFGAGFFHRIRAISRGSLRLCRRAWRQHYKCPASEYRLAPKEDFGACAATAKPFRVLTIHPGTR